MACIDTNKIILVPKIVFHFVERISFYKIYIKTVKYIYILIKIF